MSSRYLDEGSPASGRKVMLAIPTYDRPDTSLTFSLARSREALHAAGVGTALLILEAIVTSTMRATALLPTSSTAIALNSCFSMQM